MSAEETWAALFERAPEGVSVADVHAALTERRASEAGGDEEGGHRDRDGEAAGDEEDATDG